MLRLGFHSAAFFAHRSPGSDALLIAKRHFNLLCVSIQHGILAAFILSTAVAVLLFMYSIQSSSSLSAVSISSSVSLMKETSLSWSQSVFELLPSAVWIFFFSMCVLCETSFFDAVITNCAITFLWSYIVLSAAKFCIISHCFIQSPPLFPSLSVLGPTLTHTFDTKPGPQFSVEFTSHNSDALLFGFRELLD